MTINNDESDDQIVAPPDRNLCLHGWDLMHLISVLDPAMLVPHDGLTIEACRRRLMDLGFSESEVGDGLVTFAGQEDEGAIYDVHVEVRDGLAWLQLEVDEDELCAWYSTYEQFERSVYNVVRAMVTRPDESIYVTIKDPSPVMDVSVVNALGTAWSICDVRTTIPDLVAAIEANPRTEMPNDE